MPSRLRVLELGNYIIPAYAGMILAEQGHQVEKWVAAHRPDPIQELTRGDELWAWINHGKTVLARDLGELATEPCRWDIVIDNFLPASLERACLDPPEITARCNLRWISVRSDTGGRSFDVVAQARSIMEYTPWVPFYLGDTTVGLWLAFKATVARDPGHYLLGQATCLQKLVEGELVVDVERSPERTPWDEPPESYSGLGGEARVSYRGETIIEPARDRAWKLEHLWHDQGRCRI